MHASTNTNGLPGLGPEAYRQWREASVGAITEQLQWGLILDLLGDIRGLEILDVGCGDGSLAIELHKRGANVTGIDRSSAMIDAAKAAARRQHAEVPFIVGPTEAIPVPAARFDILVAVTILCFIEDFTPAFAEEARVLRSVGDWSSANWGNGVSGRQRGASVLGSVRPMAVGRFRTASELQR